MAILNEIFVAEREINHEEHQRLAAEVAAFEAALQGLTGPSNGVRCTEELRRLERRLSDAMPRHFATEEKTVLASLGHARPEAKPFCKAMKRQHAAIQHNWEKFRKMIEELAFTPEPAKVLADIRQHGLYFSRQLLQHMNAEDKKIAELLG
jgi:hemerythrin